MYAIRRKMADMTGSRMRYGQHPNESWGPNWRVEYDKFIESCRSGKITTCPYCKHPVYFNTDTKKEET